MSEIFYSEVDANLWGELNARAAAGYSSRTNKDIDFMVGKVANVMIIPYEDETKTKVLEAAILGGKTVRDIHFLPDGPFGFLRGRIINPSYPYNKVEDSDIMVSRPPSNFRTPPYITSTDITIGDHSMGLLNSATVNFKIPDVGRDLEYYENVYFRPGRNVTIIMEHPESAIITGQENNRLTDSTLPSLAKFKNLNPGFNEKDLESYRKLNMVRFDGLITSFEFNFETDMSVTATISVKGTSNVYTDLSLVINGDTKETDPAAKNASTDIKLTPTEEIEGVELSNSLPSFFSQLSRDVDILIQLKNTNIPDVQRKQLEEERNKIAPTPEIIRGNLGYFINTTDNNGNEYRYVTLGYIINFINRVILSKSKLSVPNARIWFGSYKSFGDPLFVSKYYKYMASANPFHMIFPLKEMCTYGDKIFLNDVFVQEGNDLAGKNGDYFIINLENKETAINTANIMINLEKIGDIIKRLETAKTFTVSAFLTEISSVVYINSGHSIDLKLVTHPVDPTLLLWYDSKYVTYLGPATKTVKPYRVPIGKNPVGALVRDFKLSGKLPQNASNLSYTLNVNPGEISESDIAPYLAYMYNSNTVKRVINTNTGEYDDIYGSKEEEDFKKQLAENYKKTHYKYVEQLQESKKKYSEDLFNTPAQIGLSNALQKYVQFPTENFKLSNELAAPVIPISAEFTIDGINGFRYGDVLSFADILPPRYTQNMAWSIAGVTHTVDNTGIWTSNIRTIARPKIEPTT